MTPIGTRLSSRAPESLPTVSHSLVPLSVSFQNRHGDPWCTDRPWNCRPASVGPLPDTLPSTVPIRWGVQFPTFVTSRSGTLEVKSLE